MSAVTSPSHAVKAQRVLACLLCQQRKKKCDRQHPCANCIKSRAQCVPATQITRRRKRRFPERDLLARLRKYEDLLRQNNVKFEPLHKNSPGDNESADREGCDDSDDECPKTGGAGDWSSSSTAYPPKGVYETKNMLHAMAKEFRGLDKSDSSDDDVRGVVVKRAWDQLYDNDDHLLFGSRKSTVDISTFHPDPVQIFRLWQIYLDNVNPVLKVSHAPSLQGRIIEAASNLSNISPNLEALMFSIYSMAILSLTTNDCETTFGASKADLLTKYQFGCQQALMNSAFLRTDDLECLTALFLYLLSVRPRSVPQSICSLLGVAIRIAERMGIDDESSLAKYTPLEAEMRRRLWWSLALFDSRIGEMAKFKNTTLGPFFDCKIPLNVNDSDFQIQMQEAPRVQGTSTEAIFVVVRSEIGDFIRHSSSKGISLSLNSVGKDQFHRETNGSALISLDKMINEKYIKFCDPQNPLHFMTIWMARSFLAKCQLLEYHLHSRSSTQPQDAERDASISFAIKMLDCSTKIMSSPLTKGFLWQAQSYFPFVAYIHLVQILKRRPACEQADKAWEAMSNNYEACFSYSYDDNNPFYKIFTNMVFQAWDTREKMLKQLGKELLIPGIISLIAQKMGHSLRQPQDSVSKGKSDGTSNMNFNLISMASATATGRQSRSCATDGQTEYGNQGDYSNMPSIALSDFDVDGFDWSVLDWDMINAPPSDVEADLFSRF